MKRTENGVVDIDILREVNEIADLGDMGVAGLPTDFSFASAVVEFQIHVNLCLVYLN